MDGEGYRNEDLGAPVERLCRGEQEELDGILPHFVSKELKTNERLDITISCLNHD